MAGRRQRKIRVPRSLREGRDGAEARTPERAEAQSAEAAEAGSFASREIADGATDALTGARAALAFDAPQVEGEHAPTKEDEGDAATRRPSRADRVAARALTPLPDAALRGDEHAGVAHDEPPHAVAHDEPPHAVAHDEPPEESIPPIGDLDAEPSTSRFFEGPSLEEHAEDDALGAGGAKAAAKAAPHVVARRQRFARYVGVAVAVATALCLVAVVRTLVVERATEALGTVSQPPAQPRSPREETAQAPARGVPSMVVPVPASSVDPADEVAASGSASAAPPSPASDPVDVSAAPAGDTSSAAPIGDTSSASSAAPVGDATAALEAKRASRRALEGGRLDAAIEAGERAVAADPTDGEAWLLLGAAQQERGRWAEARRSYGACVKQGTRGPVGECRAMLR